MSVHDTIGVAELAAAFGAVRTKSRVAGVDGMTPERFGDAGLDGRLAVLAVELAEGRWRPDRLLRLSQPKADGRLRRLALPTVRDRVVIEVVKRRLERPIERVLAPVAHAYRAGRSARTAVEAVQAEIARGASWAAVSDIAEFFDSVRLDAVLQKLRAVVGEGALVELVGVLLRGHQTAPGRGLAQGSALSPVLSNLFLAQVDASVPRQDARLVRYSDNLCLTAETESAATRALGRLEEAVGREGLRLKESATRVVSVADGFVWLGFWLSAEGRRVSDGAVRALAARAARVGAGLSGPALYRRLDALARGWVQYFDAALPVAVELGPHGDLLRELIASHGGSAGDAAASTASMASMATGEASEDAPDRVDDRAVAMVAELEGDAVLEGVDGWEPGDFEGGPVAPGEGAAAALAEDDGTPSRAASERARLLDEAEAFASAGDYAAAARSFEAAASVVAEVEPSGEGVALPEVESEAADLFLGLFCARQESYEQVALPCASARRDFEEELCPPGPEEVRQHLGGRKAVAVRPRLRDGRSLLGVIDVDAVRDEARPGAMAFALALAATADAAGVEVLVEETGGRGFHVWVPLDEALRADALAHALTGWIRATGRPAEGVRLEVLPGADDQPDLHGAAITLPLGVHAETGLRSRLRWASGVEVETDLTGIAAGQPADGSLLLAAFGGGSSLAGLDGAAGPEGEDDDEYEEADVDDADEIDGGLGAGGAGAGAGGPARGEEDAGDPEVRADWRRYGVAVQRLMEGCAVLRGLARKAAEVGHLDHGERLSLLYSLGHLGDSGRRALHDIIGRCLNYDRGETERQIDRMTGLPISCRRLHEKHGEGEAQRCLCPGGAVRRRGGYPTPLLHAGGFRRSWVDTLRGRDTRRAESEAAASAGGARVAVVEGVRSAALTALAQGGPEAGAEAGPEQARRSREPAGQVGTQMLGLPPHTWASGANGSGARKSIYVTHQGARVHRSNGTIAVSLDHAELDSWLVDELERVVVFGNVQVTTQAIAALLREGVQVSFFSSGGQYRGQLVSPESGNVFLRLAQHARYHDAGFRLAFSRDLVAAKVGSARGQLLRFRRNHAEVAEALEEAVGRLTGVLRRLEGVASQEVLRGLEGEAAAVYFGVFERMLRGPFRFERRSKHPAHNAVNALLNLGYTMLANEIAGRLEEAGFDPRIGLYHGVRYGRMSLALDLIEAHRVDVVDRLTLSLVNRRMLSPEDFEVRDAKKGVRLTRAALGRYLAAYEGAMGEAAPSGESARSRIVAQVSELRRRMLEPAAPGREAGAEVEVAT